MNGRLLTRLMAAGVCFAAVATAWDAEAGWRRRRCCADPCCQPVCCAPVCAPTCCETACAPACCDTCSVSYYDSCGRLVCRRAACCETIVASTIVMPAASCCSIAGAGAATATVAKVEPARSAVTVSLTK